MYYYLIDSTSGHLVQIYEEHLKEVPGGHLLIDDWGLKTFEAAKDIADEANERGKKVEYLPVDRGPYHSPRYGIVKAPEIGAPVSRAFNGDYYPAGHIKKVSKSFRRIETDDGTVFFRKRETGAWASGGWSMVHGHIDRRNPEF